MIIAIFIGLACGILSGFGIGGGTLLMLYMMNFTSLSQHAAQGINLLYFLPTSALALVSHFKNKLVDTSLAVPAIIAGILTTAAAAFAATAMDTSLLKKFFGAFLILLGLKEVFKKKQQKS